MDTVLGITELVEHISLHLTPHQIAQCLVVCRAWLSRFHPLIWRNLCVNEHTLPSATTLHHNVDLIRTADVPCNDQLLVTLAYGLPLSSPCVAKAIARSKPNQITESSASSPEENSTPPPLLCTNLRELRVRRDIWDQSDHSLSSRSLTALLNHSNNSNNLTHLNIPLDIFSQNRMTWQRFLATISNLRNLQHLTACGNALLQDIINSFLRACLPLPRLNELYCDFGVDAEFEGYDSDPDDDLKRSNPELETILREAVTTRLASSASPICSKIRKLQLPSYGEEASLMTVPFLQSDLLDPETLTMPRFNNSMTPKEIAQLAGEYCSNVRHLTCIDHFALPREMEGIRSFIHALSGLRTLRAVGFRSETINWSYGKTRSIIGALILRHSTSLEEIEFLACKKIWSKEQQRIFAQCSNLTRFWIKPTEEAAVGMKFGDIIAQEWVCGSLKELCLTLDRSVVVEEERPQFYTWSEKENLDSETIARMAYAQIGRLTKLEVLALSADRSVASMPMGTTFDWDLTLSKGYLVELSRLKNLRRLEISADLWLRMDQADVEFMDEQWPRLGEVGFGCSTKAVFQELTSQPHWRWLREKRCLQYLFLD